jgi:subtilisin family serine protease
VTAVDSNDAFAYFSSFGAEVAANGLAAPGMNMLSTGLNGGVRSSLNGTSFSSPLAAGAAALVLAKKPTASVSLASNEVKNILRGTADNIGLAPTKQGAGRLNIDRALHYTTRGTTADTDDAVKIIAAPNPFKPAEQGMVQFKFPPSFAGPISNIKIYTHDGTFVRTLTSSVWDGKNAGGNLVANGTYVFVVTTSAGTGRGRLSVLR